MANVSVSDSLYTLTLTLVSLEFAAGDSEFKKDTRSGVNPFKLIDAAADLHVDARQLGNGRALQSKVNGIQIKNFELQECSIKTGF